MATPQAERIKRIVIVGGGTAGWLTAGILAVQHGQHCSITLVEAPGIATIGVGEGTWPTMVDTLRRIGISETRFLAECDASFKQGSQFIGWTRAGTDFHDDDADRYYHPFTQPADYGRTNLAAHWLVDGLRENYKSFAHAVSNQPRICDLGLAPKQAATPEHAFVLNYGYHLDAGKFIQLLHNHCVNQLGVNHREIQVEQILSHDNGDIRALQFDNGEQLEGDLFVDCSGMRSLLLGEHFSVEFRSCQTQLFNNAALTVQVPHSSDKPLPSCTLSTAHNNGWIWDIALQSRRGIGAVFSRDFTSADKIQRELEDYLLPSLGKKGLDNLQLREIQFDPGHREHCWVNNCVAVGLSAGFIEPLEATALALIENSARRIADELPDSREQLPAVARRFNRQFHHHWQRIIDFLKLHYVLSEREGDYWSAHRDRSSWPASLAESLDLWRCRTPWSFDSDYRDELFPSASFQYVLYGMQPHFTGGFRVEAQRGDTPQNGRAVFERLQQHEQRLVGALPDNRQLLKELVARVRKTEEQDSVDSLALSQIAGQIKRGIR